MGWFWRIVLALVCNAFAFRFGWEGFWLVAAGWLAFVFMTKRPGQRLAIMILVASGFFASLQAAGMNLTDFGWVGVGFWLIVAGLLATGTGLCWVRWLSTILIVSGFIAVFQGNFDIDFGPAPDLDVDGEGFLDVIGGIGWGWLVAGGFIAALIVRWVARQFARPRP